MDVQFVGQPYEDGANLADFLTEALAEDRTQRLRVIAAWAKRSGLGRLRDALVAFRERGGGSELILGIDEEGATAQGLRLAVELFDRVHVLHERGSVTFHPKVYVAEGDGHARLMVGSNNLTAGGLFGNYEASLLCELDLSAGPDVELMEQVNAYFARLYADEEICRPLDAEFLERLILDDRYHIRDEDYRRERHDELQDEEDADAADEVPEDLFGVSRQPKRRGPVLPPELLPGRPAGARRPGRPRPRAPIAPVPAGPAPGGTVERRWFKKLNPTDAQHPPTQGSSPTGNLRLSQAKHPINHRTYFRQVFFLGTVWAVEPTEAGDLEVATVPFNVEIRGVDYGEIGLRVDHAPYREAGQNNVPTVLKWGELNAILREEDLTGDYVVLERLAGGTYRLSIASTEPDAFIE